MSFSPPITPPKSSRHNNKLKSNRNEIRREGIKRTIEHNFNKKLLLGDLRGKALNDVVQKYTNEYTNVVSNVLENEELNNIEKSKSIGELIEYVGSFGELGFNPKQIKELQNKLSNMSKNLYNRITTRNSITPTGAYQNGKGGKRKTTAKRKPASKRKTVAKRKTTAKRKPASKKKVRKIHRGPQGGRYYITKRRKVYI